MNTSGTHIFLSKSNRAIILALGMILGLLLSRAVLSACTILFGLNALYNVHPKKWLSQKWWLLGITWIAMYAISYFWTEDTHSWHERLDIKLPILLLPLAFSFLPAFTHIQLRIFTVASALLLLGSVAYSLDYFLGSPEDYINGYKYSHIIPTLVEDDHISYSVCVTTSIIWYIYSWPYLQSRLLKWFIAFTILILVIFLHILAARTGLIMLYLFAAGYCFYIALQRSKILGLGIVAGLCLVAYLAVHYIPTLSYRLDYSKYSLQTFKNGERSGLYGDVGRLMSYNIALRGIKEHPLMGVGAGDILVEMKKGYDDLYSNVSDENRLFPHNQFLVVGFACGIPAMILFILWIFAPLSMIKRNRHGLFLLLTWLVLLVPLAIEPFFEAQLCLFVYLFPLLWQRHMVLHPPVAAA